MSDLTLNERSTPPSAPSNGKQTIFVDENNGPSVRKSNGDVEPFKSLFGTTFTNKKKESDETTTSPTFVNYDTLNLTGVPQGNYLIMMRWVWGFASGANDIRVQWQLDEANIIEEHRQEPKDGGADQRHHNSSFSVIQLDGNHAITIDYASSNGSQARLFESEIVLFRID